MIDQNSLEEFIDKNGMQALFDMLETICHEKAEHVQSNWQDRSLASAWRRGAARIGRVARFADWPL